MQDARRARAAAAVVECERDCSCCSFELQSPLDVANSFRLFSVRALEIRSLISNRCKTPLVMRASLSNARALQRHETRPLSATSFL